MTDKEFLDSNEPVRLKAFAGHDLHLSNLDAKRFQAIAKGIDAERYFTIYGCESCVITLVKFVYNNFKEMVTVFTLPDDFDKPAPLYKKKK